MDNHTSIVCCSFRLNIWDVGGQMSLRSYWRNYFEQTDAMIWVVDSADVHRMLDCRAELHNLLKEEKLAGATLLIFANKQDVGGALTDKQIEQVRLFLLLLVYRAFASLWDSIFRLVPEGVSQVGENYEVHARLLSAHSLRFDLNASHSMEWRLRPLWGCACIHAA